MIFVQTTFQLHVLLRGQFLVPVRARENERRTSTTNADRCLPFEPFFENVQSKLSFLTEPLVLEFVLFRQADLMLLVPLLFGDQLLNFGLVACLHQIGFTYRAILEITLGSHAQLLGDLSVDSIGIAFEEEADRSR